MFFLELYNRDEIIIFKQYGIRNLDIIKFISFISLIVGVFFSIISRKNEFSADAYSSETAQMPESLISGLKKLSKENLSNLTPHWLNVFLNYSHPPVLERIRALRLKTVND